MNFQLNQNLGNWLSQFNNRLIDRIYKVDYNEDSTADPYEPWIFVLTFKDHDHFLQIEGDFDGEHIQLDAYELKKLEEKLNENDFRNEPSLWSVLTVDENEILGQLLNSRIEKIQYGIDKDEYTVNGETMKGEKNFFTFVRFRTDRTVITISEGLGLIVSNDPDQKLNFEETFNVYET